VVCPPAPSSRSSPTELRWKAATLRILLLDKTGKRSSGLIADMELVVVADGPHAIPWTHTGEVNA
jgi:hypothetical protein